MLFAPAGCLLDAQLGHVFRAAVENCMSSLAVLLLTAFVRVSQVAPVTAQHIFKLVAMGAYTGNHIFRVDKGFVAQVQDVVGGRNLQMDERQKVSMSSHRPLQAAVCIWGPVSAAE
jgi:hypothetical protein